MSYSSSRYHPRHHVGKIIGTTVLVAVVVVVALVGFASYNHKYNRTLTVCAKESVATSDGHEYRVYTNTGTFVMKDSLIGTTRFDTADAYAKVQEGVTYDVTYKGWRIPVMSNFPNLLSLKKAETQTPQDCDGYNS